jgi:hypothetical protein
MRADDTAMFKPIDGLGDNASFSETDFADTNSHEFTVTTYEGLKEYNFTIAQKTDPSSLTSDSARTALTTLAGQAKHSSN